MNDPARQRVAGFTLIDADRDVPLEPLSEGMTIRLVALPTRHLNIRADTWPATVGSVRFGLDAQSAFATESGAPYAPAGDQGGDYRPWTPAAGAHALTATPYTGSSATGSAGLGLTVHFTVQ